MIFHGRDFLPTEWGGSPRQAGRDRVTRKGGPLPALPESPTLPVSLVARRTRNDVSCALCHPNNNNRGVNSSWASLTTHRASWCGLGRWTGKHCLRFPIFREFAKMQHSRPGAQHSDSRSRVGPRNLKSNQLSQKGSKNESGPRTTLRGG